MGISELITIILVLAVLGFLCWLLLTRVPMPSPFREIIMFVIVIAVVLWLLSFLGVWNGPVSLRD